MLKLPYPILVKLLTIQVSTGKYFAVIILANMFWSIDPKLHFAFTFEGTQYTFNCLPTGHFNNPTIGHNLSWQDRDHIQFSLGAHVWHYIEDILLQEDSFDAHIQDIETYL